MTKDADDLLNEFGNLITWDDIKNARDADKIEIKWSKLHQRSVANFEENMGPSMGSIMGFGMARADDTLPPGMTEFEWEEVMSLGYICHQLQRSASWHGEDGNTMEGFAIFNGIIGKFGMVGMEYTMWCFNSLQFFGPVLEEEIDYDDKKRPEMIMNASKELFEEHCNAIKDWLKTEAKLNDLWNSLLDLAMADVELQKGEKELLKIAADVWGITTDL
tara:strand:- start:222 stop:875 length:654 start_codon:yes stop_codon:yes gene_type:complete